MTSSNLEITSEVLLELKADNPLEILVIMEMLAEAGEDYFDEVGMLENSLQSAA